MISLPAILTITTLVLEGTTIHKNANYRNPDRIIETHPEPDEGFKSTGEKN